MNLLLLTPQLPYPPRQGTTIRNYNLIRQLAKRHRLHLFTFLAPSERLSADNPLHGLCQRIETAPQPVRSLRRRALDTVCSPWPDMGLRLESQTAHQRVEQMVRTEAYDIVQIEGIEMARYGLDVLGIKSVAAPYPSLVFDDHNAEYLLQRRAALVDIRRPQRWIAAAYSLVQWQKLRRYEATICRRADATLAVSQPDRQALEGIAPGALIAVVPNGIDLNEYEEATPPTPPNDDEAPTLVFTGKMDYRPNVDAVLWFGRHVLPLIRIHRPNVRFQIVGMTPHPRLDELRNVAGVEITGAVADVRPYIHRASVYVVPMRVGGGTRFKVLEAMACAKPLVSTSLGVEGIPLQNERELLLGDTPQAFAAAVLRLLDDQGQGAQLGQKARRFVEQHYTWEEIVPRLEAVYQDVCRK